MPRFRKRTKSVVSIPNYSLYEFVERMPVFMETDRVPEADLYGLECYNNYEIEAPLNHFSDSMLNNHLYTMYKKGKLESPDFMRKLLSGCQLDFVKKKVFLKGLIFKKKGFCNKKKGFPCQMDSFLIPAKGFFTSCILK